jgi:hypothetical protein
MFNIGFSAFVIAERLPQTRVGRRRVLQQVQQKCRIVAGQMDDAPAFDYALRFVQGGLHHELIKRRPQQIGCLLQSVLHVLRHPGRDSAAFLSCQSHVSSQRFGICGLIERTWIVCLD